MYSILRLYCAFYSSLWLHNSTDILSCYSNSTAWLWAKPGWSSAVFRWRTYSCDWQQGRAVRWPCRERWVPCGVSWCWRTASIVSWADRRHWVQWLWVEQSIVVRVGRPSQPCYHHVPLTDHQRYSSPHHHSAAGNPPSPCSTTTSSLQ